MVCRELSKQRSTNLLVAQDATTPIGSSYVLAPPMSTLNVGTNSVGTQPMGMRPKHQSAPPRLEERRRNQNQMQYAHDLSNQQRQQATSSGSSHTSNAHPTNDAAPTHQGSFFDPGEEASAQEPNPWSHTPLGQGQLSRLRLDAFFPRIIKRGFLDDLVYGNSSANLPAQAVQAGTRIVAHSAPPPITVDDFEWETHLYFWDYDSEGSRHLRWDWVTILDLVPHWLTLMPTEVRQAYQLGLIGRGQGHEQGAHGHEHEERR
jgi:hypothetical protein